MRIIIDAMGGDHAPLSVLKGCEMAVKEFDVNITAVGDEKILKKMAEDNKIDLKNITIVHTEGAMSMCDEPSSILKKNRGTSMGVAMDMMASSEGDVLISAGNSGALLAGSTLIVKRMNGIKRPAFAPVFPTPKGYCMILDSGANAEIKAEYLPQFALMGSIYCKQVLKIDNPRVGLLNNGTEETKGIPTYVEAHALLKETKDINFIGNVEASGVYGGACDVLVCDGFTGNILLKSIEGTAAGLLGELKTIFLKSPVTKLAAIMIKKHFIKLKQKMDVAEIGGAAVLGISKPVIKAHGSSNARAIRSAILQGINFHNTNVIQKIEKELNNQNL